MMVKGETENYDRLYADHFRHLTAFFESLLEKHGVDCLVIASGDPKPVFLDDKSYPFKANYLFKYWVPLGNAPHAYLVIRPGLKPELLLHRPADYWEKSDLDIRTFWADHFSVSLVEKRDESHKILKRMVKGNAVFMGDYSQPPSWDGIDFAEINPKSLINPIHYFRAIKTAYEMASLRRANRRAICGHMAAHKAFKAGGSEFEVHLAYLNAARHLDVELPYVSIIGENENAACLHYRQKSLLRQAPGALHSMVIDAGAEYNGYIADITRSYAAYTSEFGELIVAMDEMQQKVVAAVKVGVNYATLNQLAHRLIAEILAAFDIVRLGAEEIVEKRISNVFLPHGLGHFIGLQVHDVGGHMKDPSGALRPAPKEYPALRLTRDLEAGHAMTIEPGLYFIDMLLAELEASKEGRAVNWSKIENLKKFGGIRIEDNIILHGDRVENMTRDGFAGK